MPLPSKSCLFYLTCLEFGECSYQPAFGCQEYKHFQIIIGPLGFKVSCTYPADTGCCVTNHTIICYIFHSLYSVHDFGFQVLATLCIEVLPVFHSAV